MSNLPPNPFSNVSEGPQLNANPGPPMFNHSDQFGQVPVSQLPPGYVGQKQDANSNSQTGTLIQQSNVLQNVCNYNDSGNSSPAFNQQGTMAQRGLQSSPMRAPVSISPSKNSQLPFIPSPSASPQTIVGSNSPAPFPSRHPQPQINDNAPPLVPSSQFSQPLVNGPSTTAMPSLPVYKTPSLPPSSSYGPSLMANKPTNSNIGYNPSPLNQSFGHSPVSKNITPISQTTMPYSSSLAGPSRSSPLVQGPPLNGPYTSGPPSRPPQSMAIDGSHMAAPQGIPVSVSPQGPLKPGVGHPSTRTVSSFSGQSFPKPPTNGLSGPGQFMSPSGPPTGPPTGPQSLPTQFPPMPSQSFAGQQVGPPSGPSRPPIGSLGPPTDSFRPSSGPLGPQSMMGPPSSSTGPPSNVMGPPIRQMRPPSVPMGPPRDPIGPPVGSIGPPSGPLSSSTIGSPSTSMAPTGTMAQLSGPVGLPSGPVAQPGPLAGPPMSGMQIRYPSMPPTNYNQPQLVPIPQKMGQQYNTQAVTQQMGQLSVTKQGFDQLWGHQSVDLLQTRHILPEYPEDPPEIKLGHQFADAPNCSPDIFRCTVNRIPETNSLLQKSRLPLGILIHPFKDLNHLPVIQCNTIVRCRACRTYINPFVYFVDSKRWKCNLCYRVNDLPEEFQYDPVSRSYGDPSRRPEIKSATIEFIAPGEYMLRPPQPAVYLFLLDVSQLARESGYLQVVCDTLKNSLEQLPGDARTQIGFICFDSHVHYYLMSEGLTRPKEMTVLDIDDVFLPSPESLLVNLQERKELVKELLTVFPQRYSSIGTPSCALGSALQAAYKLMAPTGGRITVFQTCLPNVGPGALEPREDPNARSSKEVSHLNPATDFYKRLALDCSGAQVAVDLFLLNSQYSDLATLSGMSKFSGGTVYHIPLFKAARSWQAEQLQRMFTRYLTRKIGFEAVMRVRCTRGITIHTFHGNFFVRSTDLLSLPNVSPDAAFGMQLCIEESLADLQQVCFQAALLYTSSKGERRIRVHTLALPIATTLPDVLHSADQQCIIGLLAKMAVDRSTAASLGEAREAVMNVAADALAAHRLAQNLPAASAALLAPLSLRLLPLYLLALLKTKAFRTGTSTRLDDRVAAMCGTKSLPLAQLLRAVYPPLYPLHALRDTLVRDDDGAVPDPPRLHLTAASVNSNGAYLLDDGESMILYIGHAVSPAFLSETFGVAAFSQVADESRSLPRLDTEGSALLHAFIERLNDDRPYCSDILILRDNSPSRQLFTERLVDDRVESAFSYYEFLQHVKTQVK